MTEEEQAATSRGHPRHGGDKKLGDGKAGRRRRAARARNVWSQKSWATRNSSTRWSTMRAWEAWAPLLSSAKPGWDRTIRNESEGAVSLHAAGRSDDCRATSGSSIVKTSVFRRNKAAVADFGRLRASKGGIETFTRVGGSSSLVPAGIRKSIGVRPGTIGNRNAPRKEAPDYAKNLAPGSTAAAADWAKGGLDVADAVAFLAGFSVGHATSLPRLWYVGRADYVRQVPAYAHFARRFLAAHGESMN